jgi:uncharacterized membrane protein
MTLTDLMQAVDKLSPEDKRKLREYLDQEEPHPFQNLTGEERARRLEAAAAKIREGLTPEQLDEMTRAMNEEYIESVDDGIWKD